MNVKKGVELWRSGLASAETLKRSLISAITAFGEARKQGLELCSLFVQNSTSQHATFRQMHIDFEGICRRSLP